MRSRHSPPTLLTLLAILFSSCPHTVANPYPRNGLFALSDGASFLRQKRCPNPCGWSGQLCCGSDQQCYTDNAGQAQCGPAGGGGISAQGGSGQQGQWQMFTTTWVETGFVTRVSTYSSYVTPQVTAQAFTPASSWVAPAPTQMRCDLPCGNICCAPGQYCAMAGQCAAEVAGGFSSSYFVSQSYSAPLRPTSGTVTTTTSTTGAVTATVPFQTPVGTANNIIYGTAVTANRGLSAGAIAGIVIGIILLLLLIALALCFRGAKGLFGRRKETEVETTYIHRRHHHGAGDGRTWYGGGGGGRPPRPSSPPRKGGGLGGFGGVMAGLGALALALGLKRRYDRRKEEEESSYGSGSTYYSEYDTTTSSESTDPRSRR